VKTIPEGSPPMAYISDTFDVTTFCTACPTVEKSSLKWTPSTAASEAKSRSAPGESKTAVSSPSPAPGNESLRNPITSRSLISRLHV
jgi:hypothetical protein